MLVSKRENHTLLGVILNHKLIRPKLKEEGGALLRGAMQGKQRRSNPLK